MLGHIMPNILLSVQFFLLLIPHSTSLKLLRKDPLMLSLEHSSSFIDINKEIDKKTFEKIW